MGARSVVRTVFAQLAYAAIATGHAVLPAAAEDEISFTLSSHTIRCITGNIDLYRAQFDAGRPVVYISKTSCDAGEAEATISFSNEVPNLKTAEQSTLREDPLIVLAAVHLECFAPPGAQLRGAPDALYAFLPDQCAFAEIEQ